MEKKIEVNGKVLNIKIADTFWARFCGLMGSQSLNKDKALLIQPCNSIHMMGMRYAIDVVYLDNDFKIIKVVESLRPWIDWSVCKNAQCVLELANGAIKVYNFRVGQKVCIRKST